MKSLIKPKYKQHRQLYVVWCFESIWCEISNLKKVTFLSRVDDSLRTSSPIIFVKSKNEIRNYIKTIIMKIFIEKTQGNYSRETGK